MNDKEDLNRLLKEHIRISRAVSKHFLKIGKKETTIKASAKNIGRPTS